VFALPVAFLYYINFDHILISGLIKAVIGATMYLVPLVLLKDPVITELFTTMMKRIAR
jgi:hypothetical protein